jgi:hypothetical protein
VRHRKQAGKGSVKVGSIVKLKELEIMIDTLY